MSAQLSVKGSGANHWALISLGRNGLGGVLIMYHSKLTVWCRAISRSPRTVSHL